MAAHGMYRRRETRHDQLAGEIAPHLRTYSLDAQHIGHAFAGLPGLNAVVDSMREHRDDVRAGRPEPSRRPAG